MDRAERIDRRSALPYHHQLRQILLGQVGGVLKVGDMLPSEGQLGERYGVSRTVVRQALNELAAEGLIRKVKGKGAFVARTRVDARFVQQAAGFYDEMVRQGHRVTSQVLLQRTGPPTAEAAALLEIPASDQVLQLDRLRLVDGEPMLVVRTSLPHSLCAGLEHIDLTDGSLYAVLREQCGLEPHGGRRIIRTGPAARPDARLLRVRTGSPVFTVESIIWDSAGIPFEYFLATYPGDRVQFDIDLVSP